MRNFAKLAVAAVFSMGLLAVGASSQQIPESLREAVDLAVSKVKPALVRIHVVSTTYREGRELKYESFGSGVIVTEEGHVVTNHHVAGHATRLVCTMSNREEIDAELVGSDPLTDIAVIKLLPTDGRTFPTASFGDSSKVRVGDHVLAMGSPQAISQSVTLGIVSNAEMILPRRMFGRLQQDGEDVGGLVRWIAHDAQIYGGNSGGPLVNTEAQIIGINEISVGLAGAIPGNLARTVSEEIIKRGRVDRGWIGLSVRPMLKHSGTVSGVFVQGTIEGAPADTGGIESGDRILRVDGDEVSVRFEEDIPAFNGLIAALPVDTPARFEVVRSGKALTLDITPTLREKVRPQQHELKQWGITSRNISYVMSKEMKLDSRDGAVVTTIAPGGAVGEAKPAIFRGDIIIDVGGVPIASVEDLERVTAELTEGSDDPVPVLTTYERRGGTYITVVKVGVKELTNPGIEVRKAWLPVETQVITRDIAKQLGKEELRGFRLTKVFPDSAAEEAGLKVGDFVIAVDGEKLTASAPEHYEELPTLIRTYRAGSLAEFTLLRGEDRLKLEVKLPREPKPMREMQKYREDHFEFTARDVSFEDRTKAQLDGDVGGALVVEVKSGGWAALGSLQVGDLIREINDQTVSDSASLGAILEAAMAERPASVVFKVRRGIYTVYVEVEPMWIED
jgi:serine protease Do